jgi:alanine racemase
MKNFFQKFLKPRANYEPLIEVRVFKDAILHNLNEFRKTYPNVSFAPVLKSNAYGHGLVEVANILEGFNKTLSQREKSEIPFFVVDSFYEALTLRQNNIKTKILILGFSTREQIQSNLKNVSVGIISLDQLKMFDTKQKINIQLKIDTGMHRQGILISEIAEAIKIIKQNKNLNLEGLCSHFGDADAEAKDFTEKQIVLWNETVKKFKAEFNSIKYFHTSNTAGAFYLKNLDVNTARIGIGLFGFNQSVFEKLNLQPALEMASIITSVKTILKGEKVGYNGIYTAEKNMQVATVPVGYYEGLDRRLSNKGLLKVGKVFCPIVGRVSMNMCSIDVSEVKNVKTGDEVIVISKNIEDKNSLENIAKICGTIPYEILIHVPQSLKRVIFTKSTNRFFKT